MGSEQQRQKRLLAKRRRQKARKEQRVVLELPAWGDLAPSALEPEPEAQRIRTKPKVSEILTRFARPWTDALGKEATPEQFRFYLELAAMLWNRLVLDDAMDAWKEPPPSDTAPSREELAGMIEKFLGLTPAEALDEIEWMDERRRAEVGAETDLILPVVSVSRSVPGHFFVQAMRVGYSG